MMLTPPKAGVLGWPIAHSLSPRLHRYWLLEHGIDGTYDAFAVEPDDLLPTLKGLKEKGIVGVNLTIPHKIAACGIVDTLTPEAKRIGAINLVTVDAEGRLHGRNTDVFGFEQNLRAAGYTPATKTAFVLGAGGACRAVLVALQNMGFSEIRLANRTKEKAESLAKELSTPTASIVPLDWQSAPNALETVDLLVNATSLGMTGQPPLEFSLDALSPQATVTDIVYSPLETDLLRRAKQRGCRAIDGLGMLLHQARPAFQAFFGPDPQVTEALRAHVLEGRR
jgi:shikimate dehydrogenase